MKIKNKTINLNRLFSKICVKHFAVLLTVLFILCLLPLLAVAKYNCPSADDFSYSAACRQVWLQSHSFWQVLKEACATVSNRYITWQGTYATVFFMALQPSIWNEHLYAVVPFIMAGSLIISIFFLTRTLVTKFLKGSCSTGTILSLLLLFPIIQCMPSAVEGLYWFNGSINYIVPFAATLTMIGLFLSLIAAPKHRYILKIILAVICAFFSAGGNLNVGLITSLFLISFICLLWFKKYTVNRKTVSLITILYFLLFFINVFAPGNFQRSANLGGMNLVKTVLISFRYALSYPIEKWLDWTIFICLFLAIPFLWKLVKNSTFQFPCPILVVIYSYCLLSSSFAPNLFAVGNVEAGRIQNLIFILLLILLYINTGYILGWFCRRFEIEKEKAEQQAFLSKNQCAFTIPIIIMCLFGAAVTIIPNPDYYTSTAALSELVSGEAKAYDEEVQVRNALLNGPDQSITLPAFKHQPDLLYFTDITTDPEDWTNKAMCRYYNKQSVILSVEQ